MNLETVSSSQRTEKSVVSKKVQPLILKHRNLKIYAINILQFSSNSIQFKASTVVPEVPSTSYALRHRPPILGFPFMPSLKREAESALMKTLNLNSKDSTGSEWKLMFSLQISRAD